jgi:hypothetical protein
MPSTSQLYKFQTQPAYNYFSTFPHRSRGLSTARKKKKKKKKKPEHDKSIISERHYSFSFRCWCSARLLLRRWA